jgi:hypothetical protein
VACTGLPPPPPPAFLDVIIGSSGRFSYTIIPGSVIGGIIMGMVHVQKNMNKPNKPAKAMVIIVAREFFLASKDADIA